MKTLAQPKRMRSRDGSEIENYGLATIDGKYANSNIMTAPGSYGEILGSNNFGKNQAIANTKNAPAFGFPKSNTGSRSKLEWKDNVRSDYSRSASKERDT